MWRSWPVFVVAMALGGFSSARAQEAPEPDIPPPPDAPGARAKPAPPSAAPRVAPRVAPPVASTKSAAPPRVSPAPSTAPAPGDASPSVRWLAGANRRPNYVYLQGGGTGLFYGVGYERTILGHLGLGASFSALPSVSLGQPGAAILFIAPHVTGQVGVEAFGILHSAVLQAGPEIVVFAASETFAKTFGLLGTDKTTVGFHWSVGYELRWAVTVRALFTSFYISGSYQPWFTLSLGWAF
ncbi:MAG: hypothetical protein IT371_03745 [Deltaproteobacteria bacterium]|nr:hypothetical protein [Deltaproteobacteria bacterium]